MQALYTIGAQGRHDEDFLAVLKARRIDAVIDIRLRNEGKYYRFASGKHIKALCEANGIAYRHETRFSPTGELLDRFRADPDWPAYEQAYLALIEARNMAGLWREIAGPFERPCLLCAERTAETCHRRLLAEGVAERNACPVIHL